MHVTLLGTGTSVGIPIIGCPCRVCTSPDPRDRRTRCACLVEVRGLSILIDAGPDFRQQMLREGVTAIDAVLFTHHHFDHVAGLDDLRPYFFENPLPMPCYSNATTAARLQQMFPWVFDPVTAYAAAPRLELKRCDGPFRVRSRYGKSQCVQVTPIELQHGETSVLGYRIGRFAYLTDTSHVPEAAFDSLQNLDILVIDALRQRPHKKHLSIGEAIGVGRRVRARQTVLIHMTHRVKHAEEDAHLPEGFMLGYDGLRFDVY